MNNVLHKLKMKPLYKNDIENANDFVVGEYINEFSLKDETYKLHPGVIGDIYTNNVIVVSYLLRTDTEGKIWVFPDKAQLVETETEQALMRNIHVTYKRSVRIKCKVESDLYVSELDNPVEQLKK